MRRSPPVLTILAVFAALSAALPVAVVGSFSFILSKGAMLEVGLSQIEDALDGGYELISSSFAEVEAGVLSKEQAVEKLRTFLAGPVTSFSAVAADEAAFEGLLSGIGYAAADLVVASGKASLGDRTVATLDTATGTWKFGDEEFDRELRKLYAGLPAERQFALANGPVKMTVRRDISKAVLKMLATGYVWAITGDPDGNAAAIHEAIHPSLEGADVKALANYRGETVGLNIGRMNGRIAGIQPDEMVRYDYEWKNPTDKAPRRKIVLMRYFAPWNWVVAAGLYEDEFFGPLERIRTGIAVGAVLAALFATVSALAAGARLLVRPLRGLARRFEELAGAGADLTVRLDASGIRELGDVARDYNRFAESLAEVMVSIRERADGLDARADELASQAEESAASVVQMMANTASVGKSTMEQDELAVRARVRVTEILEQVRGFASLASLQRDAAKTAGDAVNAGSGSLEAADAATADADGESERMGELSRDSLERARRLADSLVEVRDLAVRVGEVTSVIMDVFDRTNLLAMNAAIEAARAGVSGRGFGVVAGEIRKLADESSHQARLIDEVAKGIGETATQAATAARELRAGFEELDAGVVRVRAANSGAAEATRSGRESNLRVKDAALALTGLVEDFERRSRALTELGGEVGKIVDDLSASSGHVADAMKEQSAAAKEIADAANALKDVTTGVREVADGLAKEVGRFRIS